MPRSADAAVSAGESDSDTATAIPDWFADFLIDRAPRKPSEHTMKACRQDFAAVARLLTAGGPIALADVTKRKMRAAFAAYAATHEPASIRRCWSTWNMLCDFLYTAELIPANPMPFVGRPKATKTLPRSLPQPAVGALLEAVDGDHASQRRAVWAERDLALILTGLLAGLRADELRRADVGDIRTAAGSGAVIHVRGKGSKDRLVPIETDLSDYRGLPRQSGSPLPRHHEITRRTRTFAMAGERPAVRGPRRRADHPRNHTVACPPRLPARWPERPAGARRPRSWAAPYLRH